MGQGLLADPDDVGLARRSHRGGARLAGDQRHLSEERVLEKARHILFPGRRVDEDPQLATRHQEERITRVALTRGQLPVVQSENGQRAQHGRK